MLLDLLCAGNHDTANSLAITPWTLYATISVHLVSLVSTVVRVRSEAVRFGNCCSTFVLDNEFFFRNGEIIHDLPAKREVLVPVEYL